jgi:hypothetical protein
MNSGKHTQGITILAKLGERGKIVERDRDSCATKELGV